VSTALSSMHDLEIRILKLEQLQKQQIVELKASAADLLDSISPAGILKSALKDVAWSPDLRNSAINTAIGIGAGFLGEKIYVGNSKNIFKKISGTVVQFLIANYVRKKIPGMVENNVQHSHES
jgi:hypothetical protein